VIYLANPTGDAVTAMLDGRLGYIDTPAQGNVRPAGVTWCADNGAFGKGYPGDEAFMAWLARQTDKDHCLFATAPDAICDHQRTYRRSDRFLYRIRSLGYRVAFVAQNGARPYNVPWSALDVLFVGGDDDWKLGAAARELVAEARSRGKWVHMGRVNSRQRYRYAQHIGCDSADGTYLTFGPDVNLPKLLGWVHEGRTQTSLWDVSQPSEHMREATP
jgi:hypothetical protein